MQKSFDAFRYIEYLRARWRFTAIVCGVSVAIALVVTFLTPKRYTATASIVIEAPPWGDPRMTTAVSPIYLESLKGYEQFAFSDSLFVRAAERFHLLHGETPSIESLKRRVLKVSKLRDTKILQIGATLTDPKQAHELVEYIADETVKLSHSVSRQADQQVVDEAGKQLEAARAHLDQVRAEWDRFTTTEPVEALRSEVDSSGELKAEVDKQLLEATANEAEYGARQKTLKAAGAPDTNGERSFVERELEGGRARAILLEKQSKELADEINRKSAVLSHRMARRGQMDAELKTAQAMNDAAASHLREAGANSGFRGESLQVIDPGIVPQRPTSPNLPLNVLAALLAAFTVSIVYLSMTFAYNLKRAESLRYG